jgi:hypothetical protein
MSTLCFAADVSLEWDANEEPEVIGYNIYGRNHLNEDYRLFGEILEQDFDNPLFPTVTFWNLNNNLTYYFVATAFSEDDESEYSNEVVWTAPTSSPKGTSKGSSGGGCFISTVQ